MNRDEYRHWFFDQNPDLLTTIKAEVSSWPPMNDEALKLCRAARDAYLAELFQQAIQEPKTVIN